METIRFVVPLTPPSANHYVRHVWTGRRAKHYQTAEAVAFKNAVRFCANGQRLSFSCRRCAVRLAVFLAKGERLDIDNAPKLCLDGLKGAVIATDAIVKHLEIDLDRDWQQPRTEIEIQGF
jgi:Holliday junction resolvase RusA-like endonuclease